MTVNQWEGFDSKCVGSTKGWSSSVWGLIRTYLGLMGLHNRSISRNGIGRVRGSCDQMMLADGVLTLNLWEAQRGGQVALGA